MGAVKSVLITGVARSGTSATARRERITISVVPDLWYETACE